MLSWQAICMVLPCMPRTKESKLSMQDTPAAQGPVIALSTSKPVQHTLIAPQKLEAVSSMCAYA